MKAYKFILLCLLLIPIFFLLHFYIDVKEESIYMGTTETSNSVNSEVSSSTFHVEFEKESSKAAPISNINLAEDQSPVIDTKPQKSSQNESNTSQLNRTNLRNKKANEKRIKEENLHKFEENLKPANSGYDPEEMLEKVKQIEASARESDWDAFLSSTDEVSTLELESLKVMMMQAAVHNAPFEVFVELLNRGAEFNADILMLLSSNNNLVLLKQLITIGLDVSLIDNKGRNAIYYSMHNFPRRDVFDFLLGIGVKPINNSIVTNSLDRALELCLLSSEVSHYANRLVIHGAAIEESHLELLGEIRNNPRSCYRMLSESLQAV